MIRNISEHNETVKPNDFELDRLRAALPEYFDSDGSFMIDRLQQALQDGDVDLTREGYELKFLGKSFAKYLTSTKTKTVVVPDLEHNSKPENADSENLYIVGDNLDALKHLLGSYAGKVNCIYIDPPYNTGSDGFVYTDDFGFSASQLVEKIGLTEDEAERLIDLRGKSSHSAWLTFMYPRLQLAKELLADDGVIFISIDDNEQGNLKLLCDEIFGEANDLGIVLWKKKTNGNNMGQISPVHDYVMAYAKNEDQVTLGFPQSPEELLKQYKNPDNDPRGPWDTMDLSANHEGPYFGITNPATGEVHYPSEGRYWVFNKEEVQKRIEDGRIIFGKTGTAKPVQKVFMKDRNESSRQVDSWWEDVALNSDATEEQKALFGESKLFPSPKPVKLIKTLLKTGQYDLILDFFSGSATTAHATMELNAEDKGSRRYICVQLPEMIESSKKAYSSGYRTIDQLARHRIVQAAEGIRANRQTDVADGFRLFRLEEPSGQILEDLLTFDPEQSDKLLAADYVSKFDLNGTPGHDTVLATWMVEDGHSLTAQSRKVTLAGYELDVCGDSAYIISPGLASDDVVELVRLLENGDLAVSRVVVFGYSVTFGVMHELKKNLSVLKSGRTVSVIERL